MKTCVVIPTYNERENVDVVVAAIESVAVPELSVLFVDDSSPDGTSSAVDLISKSNSWVHLLRRDSKRGIGSAYQDGFGWALEKLDPEILVEMDADLQHPPETIPSLVRAVEGGADVAVASRYVPGGGIREWGKGRRLVSRGANALTRVLLGLPVKDCTSGIRAYRREAALTIVRSKLPAKGFEFQVATLHLLKGRAKVVEVPYSFGPRRAGRSKLKAADMVRFLFFVVGTSVGIIR